MVEVAQSKQPYPPLREDEVKRELETLRERGSEEYASRLARKLGLGYVDLNLLPINSEDVSLIKQEDAERFNLAIFFRAGNLVRVGIIEPENIEALQFLQNLAEVNEWEIKLYVISPSSLQQAHRQYRSAYFVDSMDVMRLTLTGDELENFDQGIEQLLDLKNKVDSCLQQNFCILFFLEQSV